MLTPDLKLELDRLITCDAIQSAAFPLITTDARHVTVLFLPLPPSFGLIRRMSKCVESQRQVERLWNRLFHSTPKQ